MKSYSIESNSSQQIIWKIIFVLTIVAGEAAWYNFAVNCSRSINICNSGIITECKYNMSYKTLSYKICNILVCECTALSIIWKKYITLSYKNCNVGVCECTALSILWKKCNPLEIVQTPPLHSDLWLKWPSKLAVILAGSSILTCPALILCRFIIRTQVHLHVYIAIFIVYFTFEDIWLNSIDQARNSFASSLF